MEKFTVVKHIALQAPIERVFSALTNSQEIPKYFPLTSVESTWEAGSEVLYKGELNGVPFTDFGVIEQLAFPTEYRYRYWSDNHGTEKTAENHLVISYELEKIDEGTMLTIRQNHIPSLEMYELMESQVWDFLLQSFTEYIEANP